MSDVVGRDRELATVERCLREAREQPLALFLEGEAGIGKTVVWRRGLELAEQDGFLVLSCRAVETETKLGYASLADLLEPVGDEVLARLPDPQRRALDVVLLRVAPRRGEANARATAAGTLSLLRLLARESPVLVAVDDVQWLDRASATSLSFALRRLRADDPVALVATRRIEAARERPLELAELPQRVERARLEPLTLSGIYHVIRSELGLVFPRPTLRRILEAAGGNPLFAVELARALEVHGGRPRPGEPLPVPGDLVDLIAARVARLPARTREWLLATALLATPTTSGIDRALGRDGAPDLERAARDALVDHRDGAISLRHPLVGEATAASASPETRRALHARLAAVLDNEEEQARHLALAFDGPDAGVAAVLERAAERAQGRGAPGDAVELLDLSCRLTPADDSVALAQRRVELADVLVRAGDSQEAVRVLAEALDAGVTGAVRARALELRARIHWVAGTAEEGVACCEEALEHVGDDEELRARVLVTLARLTIDMELFCRRGRTAIEQLDRLERADPRLLAEGAILRAGVDFRLRGTIDPTLVEQALELERAAPPLNVGDRMSGTLATWLKYLGDFEGARYWLEASRRAAVDEGDEGSLPFILGHLPQLELWTGHWAEAERSALEHLELAERTGQSGERLIAIYNLSVVQAHMGRLDEARSVLDAAVQEAETGDPWNLYLVLSALGFVELSAGRIEAALQALERSYRVYEDSGAGETPAVFENLIEALVLAGRPDDAERVLEVYEGRARAVRTPMALAPSLRSRALILAERKDIDVAVESLTEALGYHEQVEMPFSRARTLLVLGEVQRRRGERRAAREALEEAAAIFDRLGSPPWSERAKAALLRVPTRRRAASDDLTPTESRIVELVLAGSTNREIAQALFVTEKTVEANLTRVYRKLGVRSRAALAAQAIGSKP
jgi:DNA-binding CsgD family transcriptional regulator